jgi:hypothetical protein
MTISFIVIDEWLLLWFITSVDQLPKLLFQRPDFVMIPELSLPVVIQLILQLLVARNLDVRDVTLS